MIGYKNRYQEWLKGKDLPVSKIVFKAFEINPVNNSSNQRRSMPNDVNRDGSIDWEKENKRKRL